MIMEGFWFSESQIRVFLKRVNYELENASEPRRTGRLQGERIGLMLELLMIQQAKVKKAKLGQIES